MPRLVFYYAQPSNSSNSFSSAVVFLAGEAFAGALSNKIKQSVVFVICV